MKRVLVSIAAAVAMTIFANSPLAAQEIGITVSPNVINIASESTVVTVHTDIAYSLVDGASVFLNGVKIDWSKSDNQGCFVAKFLASDVKALFEEGKLELGTNTLVLDGKTIDGGSFSGSDTVKVINIVPKKK